MNDHTIPEDLSIPTFLRTTSAGDPCQVKSGLAAAGEPRRPAGIAPSCWEEMNRDSDVRQAADLKAAIAQYENEKRLVAFQQWAAENPDIARMNRQAKRAADRRIAKLGIPPATRRSR